MHPDFQDFVEQQVRRATDWSRPGEIGAARAHYAQWSRLLPPIDDSLPAPLAGDFTLTANGQRIHARLYMPADRQDCAALVWFHGGGGFRGGIDTHDGLCRHLCAALGLAVVAPALPLMPEIDGATQAATALATLELLAQGRERLQLRVDRLFVGGDGSGALGALMAALRLNARRPATVDAALLLYPASKPDLQTGSHLRHRQAPLLDREMVSASWSMLLGADWGGWHPDRLPFHFPPEQLSVPSLIVAAQRDALHEDAVHLHDYLAANGARVDFCGAPEMPHDFARLAGLSPVARRLLAEVLQRFSAGFVQPTTG